MTDGHGTPLAAAITAGQRHESTMFETVMDAVKIGPRRRPIAIAGDKAFASAGGVSGTGYVR